MLVARCHLLFLCMRATMKLRADPDNVLWLLQAVKDRKYDFSGAPPTVQHCTQFGTVTPCSGVSEHSPCIQACGLNLRAPGSVQHVISRMHLQASRPVSQQPTLNANTLQAR